MGKKTVLINQFVTDTKKEGKEIFRACINILSLSIFIKIKKRSKRDAEHWSENLLHIFFSFYIKVKNFFMDVFFNQILLKLDSLSNYR